MDVSAQIVCSMALLGTALLTGLATGCWLSLRYNRRTRRGATEETFGSLRTDYLNFGR